MEAPTTAHTMTSLPALGSLLPSLPALLSGFAVLGPGPDGVVGAAILPLQRALTSTAGGASAPLGGDRTRTPKIDAECVDGEFEEPLIHDVTTFKNPPKSGFYNAVHMSLIPKGPHRGHVLTFDIDPTHFEDEGEERGTWVQRWSIVRIPDMDSEDEPAYLNGELEMTACGGDIFCSGHAWDAEGRLFVAGGTSGWGPYDEDVRLSGDDPDSSIGGDDRGFFKGRPCHPKFPDEIGARFAMYWDPRGGFRGEWVFLQGLQEARYYPTVHRLPDGRMMVMGGGPTPDLLTYWNSYEVWDPSTNTWDFNVVDRVFPGPVYPDGRDPIQLYPRMHALTTGESFLSSMTGWAAKVDHLNAPGVWTIMGHTGLDYRIYGTAVTLPEVYAGPDHVMIAGGDAYVGTTIQTIRGFGSTDTVQVADAGAPSAPGWKWRKWDPNHRARTYPMLVTLPDATLMMTGGQTFPGPLRYVGSTELFTPETRTWREIGDPYPFLKHGDEDDEHVNARAYHQGALLLPDGRVLIGGGNVRTSDYVIYRPPYLTCGLPRPVITGHPVRATWNEPVTVEFEEMPQGYHVNRAVLMSPGSTTHHVDYSASHIELDVLATASDHIEVAMPPSPNHASPGFYMLFLLSHANVPSEAGWIKLR